MIRPAMLVLAVAAVSGCRSRIQLGDPDSDTPSLEGGVGTVPPRCIFAPSRSVIAIADDTWGEPRALAAGNGSLYVLFASPTTSEGVLARAPTTGGALAQVARVGLDPSALAMAADASFVFATSRGDAKVFRVDNAGGVVATDARGAPSSIFSDATGGAIWTLPADDSVVAWDVAGSSVKTLATTPRPTSILRVASTLYVVGNQTVSSFEIDRDAAPHEIAARCDAGAPAIDGQTLYCADHDTIARVDLASGAATVAAEAQPGARDVVVAAGRVFWRAARPGQTLVMSLPLDGVGGPTVVESAGNGPLLMALDGCDLYFTAGRSLVRRRL